MHLRSMISARIRRMHNAPIDCVIGLLLLALCALAIVPGVAFFTACAVIAAIGSRLSPAPRAAPARIR